MRPSCGEAAGCCYGISGETGTGATFQIFSAYSRTERSDEKKPGPGDIAQRHAGPPVDNAFRDRSRWTRMALCNIARTGFFSSDRSVREYAEKIWNVAPVPVSPEIP